jgi:hypothetical protein
MTDRPIIFSALEDIAAERARQISVEGWTPDHDDAHNRGELARAAACYALSASLRDAARASKWWPSLWPWSQSWWKPTNRRRDLVKAGALLLAEIERLDRLAAQQPCGECRLQPGETCDICGRKQDEVPHA